MSNERKVTIKDVAEELGLSTATVSNVIHGKTKKISDMTVKKVQEQLEQSGYIPNMAAVLLARNSSRIVCVVLSNHEKYHDRMIEDPFVSAMLNTISKELKKRGYFMMVQEEKDIEQIIVYASMWNMAGLILMGYCFMDYEKLRANMHIPFVVVDSYEKNVKSYIDVGIDNIDGGYQAGKFLIENGHKEIFYIAQSRDGCDLDRYIGLKKAMLEKELPVSENNLCLVGIEEIKKQEDYQKIFQEMRLKNATAVFCASDVLAIEFMHFLMKQGVRIPEEISVMGFDDIPLSAMVYPTLSTVSQNISLRASKAVELLEGLIQQTNQPGSILLPACVITRESVANLKR